MASVAMFGPGIFAGSDQPRFEYVPSKLGINYRTIAPSPLAEILSQGEREWMENARMDFGEDTVAAWKEELVPYLSKGQLSRFMIESLQEFTPKMLTKFAAGLDPQHPKFGGLWSVGNAYIASRLAGES